MALMVSVIQRGLVLYNMLTSRPTPFMEQGRERAGGVGTACVSLVKGGVGWGGYVKPYQTYHS
jgi:hypothetical protein